MYAIYNLWLNNESPHPLQVGVSGLGFVTSSVRVVMGKRPKFATFKISHGVVNQIGGLCIGEYNYYLVSCVLKPYSCFLQIINSFPKLVELFLRGYFFGGNHNTHLGLFSSCFAQSNFHLC